MDGDISKTLSYQVKREIAQRYFGWRSAIFEDIAAVEKEIEEAGRFYEAVLGRDLVRLYSLLGDDRLIQRAMEVIGWPQRPFYDEYVVHSPTIRKRVLAGLRRRGWTDSGRFKNMVLDAYRRLHGSVQRYRSMKEYVEDELATIDEEIRMFREKFSLDEIMGFLRTLDQGSAEESVAMTPLALESDRLEARLDFPSVDHLKEALPEVPDLPEPGRVEGELKRLAAEALALHRKAGDEIPLRED